eukprot:g660.t1
MADKPAGSSVTFNVRAETSFGDRLLPPVFKVLEPTEYKYVRMRGDGEAVWDSSSVVVDDGFFGELIGEHFSYPQAGV